jgi:hypothetical protein
MLANAGRCLRPAAYERLIAAGTAVIAISAAHCEVATANLVADARGKAVFQVIEASTKTNSIALTIQKLWLTNDRDGGVGRCRAH